MRVDSRLLCQVLIATAAGWIAGLIYAYSQFRWPVSSYGFWYWLNTGGVGETSWPWLGAVVCGGLRLAWWRRA
jgi:hypothetical protein